MVKNLYNQKWLMKDRDITLRNIEVVPGFCECHGHGEDPVIGNMSQLCRLLERHRTLNDFTWDGQGWCPTLPPS